ncbi:MAG TPA: transcriptional regulator [Thermoanaerobaculia bacterium]|nr:transcriptional regulator [Thermoanaerobaculia bacterium]
MRKKTKRLSRLGKFIRDHELIPNEVADVTGISRQHLLRLRRGKAEPTRPMMIWITIACRRLVGGRRRVRLTELFDLGDGEK